MDKTPVALVTGGTGGIGAATAALLAEKGYRVWTMSRRGGTGERDLRADVTDEASVRAALGILTDAEGRLDLLVNCAGAGISGAAELTAPEASRFQTDVNLFGTDRLCRAVIPLMRERGGGRIVNVSSVAAVLPIPFQTWYSVSKAGINAYTMALSGEVGRFGIKVCAVMPGDTKTGFTDARRKIPEGDDVYGGAISRSVSRMEADERSGDDPIKSARVILRAARARIPRPFYTVGAKYKLFVLLSRLLPGRTVRWILGLLYAK